MHSIFRAFCCGMGAALMAAISLTWTSSAQAEIQNYDLSAYCHVQTKGLEPRQSSCLVAKAGDFSIQRIDKMVSACLASGKPSEPSNACLKRELEGLRIAEIRVFSTALSLTDSAQEEAALRNWRAHYTDKTQRLCAHSLACERQQLFDAMVILLNWIPVDGVKKAPKFYAPPLPEDEYLLDPVSECYLLGTPYADVRVNFRCLMRRADALKDAIGQLEGWLKAEGQTVAPWDRLSCNTGKTDPDGAPSTQWPKCEIALHRQVLARSLRQAQASGKLDSPVQ